jgi:transposase
MSTKTVRKWRKHGAEDCQDHNSRPHKLPWKASEEERAIVCALRQATGFPLDEVYHILKAEGLRRLLPAHERKRKSGTFKD